VVVMQPFRSAMSLKPHRRIPASGVAGVTLATAEPDEPDIIAKRDSGAPAEHGSARSGIPAFWLNVGDLLRHRTWSSRGLIGEFSRVHRDCLMAVHSGYCQSNLRPTSEDFASWNIAESWPITAWTLVFRFVQVQQA
jgi:hypothetical protein